MDELYRVFLLKVYKIKSGCSPAVAWRTEWALVITVVRV